MTDNLRKYALPNLPYILIAAVVGYLSVDFAWLPWHPALVGLGAAALLRVYVFFRSKNAKKYRRDEEYGTARWGA